MSTIQERNLQAEIRAVEEGHHARLDGAVLRVASDSTPGLTWLVRAIGAPGHGVIFECRPDNPVIAAGRGHGVAVSTQPGHAPCKHAALAARRLERERLVRWEHGLWVATDRATVDDSGDPFEGFPKW